MGNFHGENMERAITLSSCCIIRPVLYMCMAAIYVADEISDLNLNEKCIVWGTHQRRHISDQEINITSCLTELANQN